MKFIKIKPKKWWQWITRFRQIRFVKFIKLTLENSDINIYINKEQISAFCCFSDVRTIFVCNHSWDVQESPEQILDMIKEK